MMNFTIYDPATGKILYNFSCNDQATADVNLINSSFISGTYSDALYYVENNIPIAKGSKPSNEYVFDYSTKLWKLDTSLLAESIRKNRNQQLDVIDRINPVWYVSLTTEQQTELATYRQALLDVPQQSGFPTDTSWPAKPAWL